MSFDTIIALVERDSDATPVIATTARLAEANLFVELVMVCLPSEGHSVEARAADERRRLSVDAVLEGLEQELRGMCRCEIEVERSVVFGALEEVLFARQARGDGALAVVGADQAGVAQRAPGSVLVARGRRAR